VFERINSDFEPDVSELVRQPLKGEMEGETAADKKKTNATGNGARDAVLVVDGVRVFFWFQCLFFCLRGMNGGWTA